VILSAQNNGQEEFSVDGLGNVNTATGSYKIGGNKVVSINRSSLFIGVGAGLTTVGSADTFCGYQAGTSNTNGSDNTFSGYRAGYSNTTGSYNSFYGLDVGYSSITGSYNSFYGDNAGYSNTTGSYNTFNGHKAGYNNTTGQKNTFSGLLAGFSNTTGSDNLFAGENAGYRNTTGNDDVYIANQGRLPAANRTPSASAPKAPARPSRMPPTSRVFTARLRPACGRAHRSHGEAGHRSGAGIVTRSTGVPARSFRRRMTIASRRSVEGSSAHNSAARTEKH